LAQPGDIHPGRRRRGEFDLDQSTFLGLDATAITRATLPRPPHPIPTFVTMANALFRDGMARAGSADLPDGEIEIFLPNGLDRFLLTCPSGSRSGRNTWVSRVAKQRTRGRAADNREPFTRTGHYRTTCGRKFTGLLLSC